MALTGNKFRQISAWSKDELEQHIRDDSYHDELAEFFGPQQYESLRELLLAPAHFGGAGKEIILLPGIMGSELKDRKGTFGKIWVDVLSLIGGDFAFLALDATGLSDKMAGSDQQAEGLIKSAYFKPQKWLERQGYSVHPFPYDWRKSIDAAARQLRDAVEMWAAGDANKQFVFVAHSMGGLVVRRYLDLFGNGAEARLDQLIMLGTPNHGSYVPLMAMKGDYQLIDIIGFITGTKETHEATKTFPGLYQMFPTLDQFGQTQIFEERFWGDPGMDQARLSVAKGFSARARLPEKMVLIACRSRKTVTRVEREDDDGGSGRLKFLGARVGDGTVPFESAWLQEVPTYLTDASHGDIQKDDAVLRAIHDLLQKGETDRLDRYHPAFAAPEDQPLEEVLPGEILLRL